MFSFIIVWQILPYKWSKLNSKCHTAFHFTVIKIKYQSTNFFKFWTLGSSPICFLTQELLTLCLTLSGPAVIFIITPFLLRLLLITHWDFSVSTRTMRGLHYWALTRHSLLNTVQTAELHRLSTWLEDDPAPEKQRHEDKDTFSWREKLTSTPKHVRTETGKCLLERLNTRWNGNANQRKSVDVISKHQARSANQTEKVLKASLRKPSLPLTRIWMGSVKLEISKHHITWME